MCIIDENLESALFSVTKRALSCCYCQSTRPMIRVERYRWLLTEDTNETGGTGLILDYSTVVSGKLNPSVTGIVLVRAHQNNPLLVRSMHRTLSPQKVRAEQSAQGWRRARFAWRSWKVLKCSIADGETFFHGFVSSLWLWYPRPVTFTFTCCGLGGRGHVD